MCVFLIGTFKFDEGSYNWIWEGQIQVPIVLGISSIIFGVLWIVESRKLTDKLVNK